jgi:hypothetical protein
MADPDRIRQLQQEEIASAPVRCRGILQRAYRGRSKAATIRATCLRCVGYLRDDVTNCSAYKCPIWPVRPYQRADEPDDEPDAEQVTP